MDLALVLVAFVAGFAANAVRLPPLVGYLAAGFVLHAFGVEDTAPSSVRPGEGLVGQCCQSGETYINESATPPEEEEADPVITAVIPLKFETEVMGAIVIYGLMMQKTGLEEVDFELFDLLDQYISLFLDIEQPEIVRPQVLRRFRDLMVQLLHRKQHGAHKPTTKLAHRSVSHTKAHQLEGTDQESDRNNEQCMPAKQFRHGKHPFT